MHNTRVDFTAKGIPFLLPSSYCHCIVIPWEGARIRILLKFDLKKCGAGGNYFLGIGGGMKHGGATIWTLLILSVTWLRIVNHIVSVRYRKESFCSACFLGWFWE